MFKAWDDAVRVLTGSPRGMKVTGERFDVLERDGDERFVLPLLDSNRSHGQKPLSKVSPDNNAAKIRQSRGKLQ